MIKDINLKKMRTDFFKEDRKEVKTLQAPVGGNSRAVTEDVPKQN
jgi:hypothetical protein